MTATTVTTARPDSVRPTHQPGFTDLLRSEWTKFRTLRSPWWSLGVFLVVSIGVSVTATSVFTAQYATLDATTRQHFRTDAVGLFLQPGSQFGQLAITVLGVLVISAEYSTGMIRATVLSAPRRTPVLLAKAAVFAGVVFAAAELVAWVCFLAGAAIVHKYTVVTLATPGALRAILGFGLVLTMTGLIALALGELLRHTAAAISVALGASLVLPLLVGLIPGSTGRNLSNALPDPAGQVIMDSSPQPDAPFGPWTGLGIVALWTIGLLAAALISIRRRNV